MSASKKKLQRKAEVDVEKVSEAEAKQAAYKKKSRTYSIIAIVIVVLVAALLVWNSGIFQKGATAATIGGEKLSVSELSYYYYNNYYYRMYAQYGISIDPNAVIDEEKGTTYRDYFLELALTDAHEIETLYRDALANGFSDADVAEDVDAIIDSYKSAAASAGYSYKAYLKAAMGRYMTPSAFRTMATHNMVASKYYSDVATEKSDSITSADLDAYYAENTDEVDTYTYSYLYFKADTISATSEEGKNLSEDELKAKNEAAMADAKAKAEAALADYNNGTAIAALIEKTEPYTSGDHAKTTGKSSLSSAYSEELLKLNKDEAAIAEYENNGYYVVIFHEKARNEELPASVYNIFVEAKTTLDKDNKPVAPDAKAWADAEKQARDLLAEWEGGKKTEESFSALATKQGMSNGGLSTGITSDASDPEQDGRINWLFNEGERVKGDTTVARYENANYGYGYYVTYFLEWEEAVWMQNIRNTLTNEHLTEWKDGLKEASPAVLTNAARNID